MAKSFDDLVKRTMTKAEQARAKRRADEMIAAVLLQQLRQAVGMSQRELAAKLKMKQPSLSKLESQLQDMRVDTLKKIIHAMGGRVEVIAKFPKGSVRIAKFSDDAEAVEDVGDLELV